MRCAFVLYAISDEALGGRFEIAPRRMWTMAKGQMRSNKEVRKPKADKKAAKPATAPAAGTPARFAKAQDDDKGKKK
ncbi:hypothetical protein DYI37_07245 [Fulvimarina endophytica]|uniref:Uncharacterized protein n=1 Tax=Fulvimarina endophytica TaxID=2293836 RepID=A0A371X4I7_9HYPH|nr:hypothetical protein DYI37_07245 [Fulvimarina endophytica]